MSLSKSIGRRSSGRRAICRQISSFNSGVWMRQRIVTAPQCQSTNLEHVTLSTVRSMEFTTLCSSGPESREK